jgi:hypothetical protein
MNNSLSDLMADLSYQRACEMPFRCSLNARKRAFLGLKHKKRTNTIKYV